MPNEKKIVECQNWIGGKWINGTGAVRDVMSPHTGQKIGQFHLSTPSDVNHAVLAAQAISVEWGRTPIKERSQILFRFREVLLRDLAHFAAQVSAESGKTVPEARAGLMKGIEVLEFALSLQNLDRGGRLEVSRGVFCEARREPLGVVAGITPFNFPAMVPMWMIPIALALGNSFIWKPSDKTPLTSLLLARALEEAGLPPGVFSVVQGAQETVESILDHPGVSAVGFVGSTPVARSVYRRGTGNGKRVLALGGAKNHVILMPDANPEIASRGITDSFTGCAGQRCMAASVLVAVGDTKEVDQIIDQVVSLAGALKLGSGPGEMGAIISKDSLGRLVGSIQTAVSDPQGAVKLRLDGRHPQVAAELQEGNWLAPTILDQVQPGSSAACDELFGPVLSIIRCKTLSEAIQISNAGIYGNAVSVFTSSGAVAERVARESKCGMIGVNIGVPVPREPFSFGGTKESKFGHGDITGESALEFWSQLKKVTMKWDGSPVSQAASDQTGSKRAPHLGDDKWMQ